MTQTRSGKDASAGDKRKLDQDEPASKSPPPSKAPKKENGDDKKQLTLDESMGGGIHERKEETDEKEDPDNTESENGRNGDKESSADQDEEEPKTTEDKTEEDQPAASPTNDHGAVDPHGRHGSTPSNILEKGIIYFFFRGRVGIDHPDGVSDVARSYILLRPIANDAKLGGGPIGDAGNSRLIAVPKKVLPKSGRDRWLAFVEKTNTSFDELKKEFLAANDYDTKTAGTRHQPAASPFGEGVYAVSATGRESHLAYCLTLPEELGEVQTEMGLRQKGSWIISTRNPEYPAPKNVALPEPPEYSKDILEEFRALRWMGTLPKHLIPNAQFLLVGESSGIKKAMQPDEKDEEREDKDEPMEEMQKLEDEDTERMEHLGKDASDAIFRDLEAQASGYPKLQTTF